MQGHDGSQPDDGARDSVAGSAGQQQARPAAAGLLSAQHHCQAYQRPGAALLTLQPAYPVQLNVHNCGEKLIKWQDVNVTASCCVQDMW